MTLVVVLRRHVLVAPRRLGDEAVQDNILLQT